MINMHAHLYMLRDGVTQSGLFATISCIWERLKDEHEVDIFQAVKQLRFHRPEIIKDLVSWIKKYTVISTSY